MPSAWSPRWSAAVPLESATACGTPTVSANSFSKASTYGPRGAIQLESNASSRSRRSSAPTSGGERWTRFIAFDFVRCLGIGSFEDPEKLLTGGKRFGRNSDYCRSRLDRLDHTRPGADNSAFANDDRLARGSV